MSTLAIFAKRAFALSCAFILIGCGARAGVGLDEAPGSPGATAASATAAATEAAYVSGTYLASSKYQNLCAAPRTGTDPNTGLPYPDQPGSMLAEQLWLRSWTNELYLWYREVPDTDPAGFSILGYFNALKTSAVTSSGKPKDRFHFTYPTSTWVSLSQSGVQAGYGAEWVLLSTTPPRKAVVAFIEGGSPAAAANIRRGAQVLAIDGVDFAAGSAASLNAGLYPNNAGETHSFELLDPGATASRTVTMVSANVTSTPVLNVKTAASGSGTVGYMLFNDHIATAEGELIAAVNALKAANIGDLVLDIRYNGGGYLAIASELAYMIAGAARTNGRTFERTQFNDKYPTSDPFTGKALAPMPFYDQSLNFSVASGQALPTLELSTVYVLTSAATCSASESIMNSLRGVGVQVIQIGSTTCGKPYGFYPQDNCGTTYFSIEFKGVNDAGFGDYADGFSPGNTAANVGTLVPGCSVGDDFAHELGDPLEGLFAAALQYRATATCPAASGFAPAALAMPRDEASRAQATGFDLPSDGGAIVKPALRENRWYR
ncbi:MAG: S41 family peptidase [Burkholderiales bacterium]